MSYFLAFLGLAVLVILHEAGHFGAAKAVGMRAERFSLFFGPKLWSKQVGETEYRIGVIPLGGYVRITGMTPDEEFETPEIEARAFYNQPTWKRVVVVAAGPAVNILIAFILAWIFFLQPQTTASSVIQTVTGHSAAANVLKPGDRLVKVDGISGSVDQLRSQIESHRCAGALVNGCVSSSPAKLTVDRDGRDIELSVRPRYSDQEAAMLLGVMFAPKTFTYSAVTAAGHSGQWLWHVTSVTLSTIAQLFREKDRKQMSSIVGVYHYTQQDIATGFEATLSIFSLISLSLALVNLLPILPLDGGHIFWAIFGKLRGRTISWDTMEKASMVGIVLVAGLFLIGLSNDITHIANGTMQ